MNFLASIPKPVLIAIPALLLGAVIFYEWRKNRAASAPPVIATAPPPAGTGLTSPSGVAAAAKHVVIVPMRAA